jgi:16S rRNA C967 or C1407 C5-methylase (RsmB/RsmF family)
MEKPSKLLMKLSQRLFANSDQQAQFIDRLINPDPYSPCILWCQTKPQDFSLPVEAVLPWQPEFVDRLQVGTKPGQTNLHKQGYYYCLDSSSVFAVSGLLTLPVLGGVIIDVCAAPGGKGIFAWRALNPALLISNEVIGKRLGDRLKSRSRVSSGEYSPNCSSCACRCPLFWAIPVSQGR